MKILLVGFGGFIGSILRYVTSRYSFFLFGGKLPYGTMIVNIIGSFLIGYIYILSIEKLSVSENIRIFVGIGILGGFTTFSSFSYETIKLLEESSYFLMMLNIFINMFFSLSFCYLGMRLGRI